MSTHASQLSTHRTPRMHLAVQYSPVILAISLKSTPNPTVNAEPFRSATLVDASVYYVIGEFVERT